MRTLDEHSDDRRADPAPLPAGKKRKSCENELVGPLFDEDLVDVEFVDLDDLAP